MFIKEVARWDISCRVYCWPSQWEAQEFADFIGGNVTRNDFLLGWIVTVLN